MDKNIMLVQAFHAFEYGQAVLSLRVEAFLKMGDERPAVLDGERVLDLDAFSPAQVV